MNIKQNYKKIMKTSLIINIFAVIFIVVLVSAPSINTFTITSGIYPSGVSYTIWSEGVNYYAKNAYGRIDYFGTNPNIVIQSALDDLTSGRTWKEKVVLKGDFEIQVALRIPSYTTLELMGRVNLANNASDYMLKNSDFTGGNEQIEVVGGIWDGNGVQQTRNLTLGGYFGHVFYFRNVTDLVIQNLEVHNSHAWAIRIQAVQDVYIHNIYFNLPEETPNRDGIHVCGGHTDNVVIDGIYGTTTDDTIALDTDPDYAGYPWGDGLYGNITNVAISNVAIKNLTAGSLFKFYRDSEGWIEDVTITNVVGYNVRRLVRTDGDALVFRLSISNVAVRLNDEAVAEMLRFDIADGELFEVNLVNIHAYAPNVASVWGNMTGVKRLRMQNVHMQVDLNHFFSENSGNATISASTSTTFNHDLVETPTNVWASFDSTVITGWTWSATDTQITITVTPSGTYTVYWDAKYQP